MFKSRTFIGTIVGVAMLFVVSGCATDGKGWSLGKAKDLQWDLTIQSYTWRTSTVVEAIDKTRSLGVKYFEVCQFHKAKGDVPLSKASPEVRQEIKQKLDQTGVKLVAYYGDLRQGETGLRNVFESAKDLGARIIVGEPGPGQIALLDKLTAEYGMKVAIHNHVRNAGKPEYIHWNPDEVMKMIEGASERIGTCPDVGHWGRSGLDTVEALKKYEGRIICVHLKDVERPEPPEARDVPFGQGICNIKGVLAELARQKFSGLVTIEYEHNPEDNMADVRECIDYFNKIRRDLNQ